MKTNLIIITTFCILTLSSFGQDSRTFAKDYKWTDTFEKEKYEPYVQHPDSSIVALDRKIAAYSLDGGSYSRDKVEHKIYYVGNSTDIEEVNRLYLYNSNDAFLRVKVRTINAAGEVVELDESKIEDISREEGATNYKILAISGIEVKSWVEIVIVRIGISAHMRMLVDNPFPTARAEVDVINSDKLTGYYYSNRKVRIKAEGMFQQPGEEQDGDEYFSDSANDQATNNHDFDETPIFVAENIPVYRSEYYSHEYANVSYVDIIDSDYSWDDAGGGLGRSIFSLVPRYQTNGINWLRKMEIDKAAPMDQLKSIEKFVKTEISKTESSESEFSDTRKIWKKKIANESGIILLTDQLLNATGIPYRVFLTSDKDYIQIDPDFAFTLGLSDVLFYFPNQDAYMIPTNGYYYLGEIPNYLASIRALVIKDKTKSQKQGRVIRLPDAKKENNINGTRAVITIDPIEEECTIEKTKFLFGDGAIRSRGYYHFSDAEEREDYMSSWLVGDLELELSDVRIQNESIDLNFKAEDTVYLSGTLSGGELQTSIPNGFIFNPGAVLGVQTSFYDTEERVGDVYISESKMYDHTIIVKIPEGYGVEGTEKLVFDEKFEPKTRWLYGAKKQYKEDAVDGPIAEFVSEVNIVDSEIRIHIKEFYTEGFYPKEGVEELKNVVNAAYEFYIAKIKFVEK